MRFRVHGGALHVHRCPEHPAECDFFLDHALAWMVGNRDAARAQLLVYRRSLIVRISAFTSILGTVDGLIARLDLLGRAV